MTAKKIFIGFHTVTTISVIAAAIVFFVFYMQGQDTINLIVFVPALIVAGIMILNSYFMYLGQFHTNYFIAMRVTTIIGGAFAVLAFAFVGAAFGGSGGDILMELASIPLLLFKDPEVFLVYGFPFFAAGTAISSFCFER